MLSGLADRVMTVVLVVGAAGLGCLLLAGLVAVTVVDVCRPGWGR